MQRTDSLVRSPVWQSMIPCFLIYCLSSIASDWFFRKTWMSEQILSSDPPWYLIGEDLVAGFVYSGSLVLCVLIALLRRWRDPVGSWMALWMSCLWMSGKFGGAAYIMVRSRDLWNPARARTQWMNADEYIRDPLRLMIHFLSSITFVLFVFRFKKYWLANSFEQRNAANETTAAG